MIYYESGSLVRSIWGELLVRQTTCRLFSLHKNYVTDWKTFLWHMDRIERPYSEVSLLFDSGAYTAFRQKEPELSVDALSLVYQKQLQIAKDFASINVFSLDKIPGEFGKAPTKHQVEEACEISNKNFEILRSRFGNIVMPVYHQGDPISQLRTILELGAVYIGVAPRKDRTGKEQFEWSQRTHNMIPGHIRSHGLGATGKQVIQSNFYSVDSSSAIQQAIFGSVFDVKGFAWPISSKNPQRKNWSKNIDGRLQDFEQQCKLFGMELNDIQTDGRARVYYNTCVLKKLLESATQISLTQPILFEV